MKKGEIIKSVEVEKLVFGGKGFAKLKSDNPDNDGKTIFITGGAIPGSIVDLKIIKKRRDYFETQIVNIVKKSPIEKKHPNNPYGETGGCKWVNIPYDEQLKIKEKQVKEAFFHITPLLTREGLGVGSIFKPIIPSPLIDGYRNKIEFSFGKYISAKEEKQEHFNVGFHKQGSFSQIQDYYGCILIDEIQNKIYKEIKDYCKNTGLPVYDTFNQEGFFRHILIRRAFFTDEIMIILGYNSDFTLSPALTLAGEKSIIELEKFLINLGKKYSEVKSIYFSKNNNKADIAIGELELIYGKSTIIEKLLSLDFEISPKSFFQTNSYGAEVLYKKVLELSNNSFSGKGKDAGKADRGIKEMTVLDLYGGTGTIGMIFAKSGAKKVISVELSTSASKDGEKNAKLNELDNIEFVNAKVEDFLGEYISLGDKADLLIIDPPRAGMHPKALPNILKFEAEQIIYVSCNPSTLARDLDFILKNSDYTIESVTPVDMFPHTHHIETVVSLVRK